MAIEAGLMAGDVIKKVNNKEVKDIKEFKEIIKTVDISKEVLMQDIVRDSPNAKNAFGGPRQKRPSYITIRPTEQDFGAWQ
ncbi:MAG: hypothetical protein ACYSW7_00065 [Planctomycetota bacterium]